MTEFEMMKEFPAQLFDLYIAQMESGVPLDSAQQVKFEYLKRLLFKDDL